MAIIDRNVGSSRKMTQSRRRKRASSLCISSKANPTASIEMQREDFLVLLFKKGSNAMMNAILRNKPNAGNSHIWFEGRKVTASIKNGGSRLFNCVANILFGLIGCLFPASASAESVDYAGKTIYYHIEDWCVVIDKGDVSYSGDVELPPLDSYVSEGLGLMMSMRVSAEAFSDNVELTSIVFPETWGLYLDEDAFVNCSNLVEVTGSACVLEIPRECFCNCVKLESVEFQMYPSTIGDYAFENCERLAEINLETARNIGDGAFHNCKSLQTVTICPYDQWNIQSQNRIGVYAFRGCTALEHVTIGPSFIGELNGSFLDTPNLKSFTVLDDPNIPENYDHIWGLELTPDVFRENAHFVDLGFSITVPAWVRLKDSKSYDGVDVQFVMTNGVCMITGTEQTRNGKLDYFELPTNINGHVVHSVYCSGVIGLWVDTLKIKDIPIVESYAVHMGNTISHIIFENIDYIGDTTCDFPALKIIEYINVKEMYYGRCPPYAEEVRFIDCASLQHYYYSLYQWTYDYNIRPGYATAVYPKTLHTAYFDGPPPADVASMVGRDEYNYEKDSLILIEWEPEYHDEWVSALWLDKVTPIVRVFSSKVRSTEPTVVDVKYRAYSKERTANVYALAFVEGVRSFSSVLRPVSFVDGDPIGPSVPTYKMQTLSWKFNKDWDVDAENIKIEILVMNENLFPDLTTASDGDLLTCLFWEYAKGNDSLRLVEGKLYASDVVIADGDQIVDRATVLSLFNGRMGGGRLPEYSDGAMTYVNMKPYMRGTGMVLDGRVESVFSAKADRSDGTDFGGPVAVSTCDWNEDGLFDFFVVAKKQAWLYTNTGSKSSPEFIREDATRNSVYSNMFAITQKSDTFWDYLCYGKSVIFNDYPWSGRQYWVPKQEIRYYVGSAYNLDGTYQSVETMLFNLQGLNYSAITSLSTGDVDGDGHEDLLVGMEDGTITFCRNTGDRSLTVQSTKWAGVNFGSPITVSLIDWDDDGKLDCLVGTTDGKLVLVRDCESVQPKSLAVSVGYDSVALDWEPNPKPGCIGYIVYRRTAGGVFVKINDRLVVTPHYRDTVTDSDLTYEYCISSVSRYFKPGESEPVVSESQLSEVASVNFGSVALNWTDVEAKQGEKFSLILSISNSMNLSLDGMSIELEYDHAVLNLIKTVPSGLFDDGKITPGGGKLYEYVFEIIDETATTASVSVASATMHAQGGFEVMVTMPKTDATISIVAKSATIPYQLGDVNGDGSVDALDVRELAKLKNAAGRKWTESQLKAGDFNNNGKLDNADYQALRELLKEKGLL